MTTIRLRSAKPVRGLGGEEDNLRTKHVALFASHIRTRVRFPPPPPFVKLVEPDGWPR